MDITASKPIMPEPNMEEGKVTERSNTSFASGRKFVQSMRRQGITNESAVKEIVDNAFDADANNVWVQVWKDTDGINILIQDDGHGMTAEELERCVAFGESGNSDLSKKIGRFGFGLPNAIVSKTKYADVYSSKKDGKYYHTYVDLDELARDPTLKLPKVKDDNPGNDPFAKYGDKLQKVDMGTIVVLKNCDELDGIKLHGTIVNHFKSELGQSYRKFLAVGKKIEVNDTPVELIDPLMLMKDHWHRQIMIEGIKERVAEGKDNKERLNDPNLGYSQLFEVDPIAIEDRVTKDVKGYITIKIAMLPIKDIQDTSTQSDIGKKYGANQAHQGFYLIRNGREIAEAQTLSLVERHNSLNYFRGEIEFDSALDDEFGIQINKGRFSLRDDIKDKLKPILRPIIRNIAKQITKTGKELDYKAMESDGKTEKMLLESTLWVPKAIKEASPEDTEKKVDELIKKIEEDRKLNAEEKEAKKEEIKKLKENKLTFDEEYMRFGPIFAWEYVGDSWHIIVNKEHPFYDYVWVPMSKHPYYSVIIRSIIHAIMTGEQYLDEEVTENQARRNQPVTYGEIHNKLNMELRSLFTNPEFIAFSSTNMPKTEKDEIEMND